MKAKFIVAAVASLLSAGSAYASPVSFSTPITVPNTVSGVYINLLTGASATSPAAVVGWDFNPWGSTVNGLSFFWPSTPAASAGGVASTTSGPFISLAPGAVISSASIFSTTASAAASGFQVPGTHILGFRFFNEATAAINYGYLSITSGATAGFPATINGWTFENSGGAITVPGATAGVPEPTTWALMLMGFGAMGAAMRRTRVTTRVRYAV